VIICVLAGSRYGDVLDYAGPNLTNNQLIIYTPNGPYGPGGPGNAAAGSAVTNSSLSSMTTSIAAIARSIGATQPIRLEETSASLQHAANGRQYSGPLYVATPQLLKTFGIKPLEINPSADILSMRPGFSSISQMQLVYGNYFADPKVATSDTPYPCPASECLANPPMQEITALPSGTSAPNTVVTEHAIETLHLQTNVSGWLFQTSAPLSASQLTSARLAASAAGMTLESKNDQPSSAQVINWATVFGIALALGILAMASGLIRSESASDIRTLAATGAGTFTRRSLTAATAGGLALLGAVVGTAIAYVGVIGYLRTNSLDGVASLSSVPAQNLLLILVGMPLAATVIGWLLAGREPLDMAHQPIE
jgi:putative ABC transport system permease protein